MSVPGAQRVQPFFLDTEAGQRFCLYYPAQGAVRGAVLYVHPFGDEMNKSRRMAALQARALAERGYGVLQLDLHGCGDSAGEFAEARWQGWLADLDAACGWLRAQVDAPLTLWGLRLGALLALDFVHAGARPVERLLLWQPVTNGATFLNQFLRLLTANAMLAAGAEGGEADKADKAQGGAALRARLLGGEQLEVAGYELAPALAAALDTLDAAKLAPRACPVHWFDAGAPERPVAPALERLLRGWREQGVDLHLHRLAFAPFWSTQEITESAELIAATSALFETEQHALSRTGA